MSHAQTMLEIANIKVIDQIRNRRVCTKDNGLFCISALVFLAFKLIAMPYAGCVVSNGFFGIIVINGEM